MFYAPTVYKYLKELGFARAVESEAKAIQGFTMQATSNSSYTRQIWCKHSKNKRSKSFTAKFGDEGIKRLREVAKKVKADKTTCRRAASTLGITYYEFVSLLKETGVTNG